MSSDVDDFYSDIKRIETRKYLLIKVKDINSIALFINNSVATLPVSYKEKLLKIYNNYNEVLILFISSMKNDNSSKPLDIFKSVVIGMCKIVEPPRESSNRSYEDHQKFQRSQPAAPKSYHSSDESSKRIVKVQIEWVYTYAKSFDSLSRKCKSFVGHICKKESDLIELDEEIAQDICNIIKQEGDTFANSRYTSSFDSKKPADCAMEFFDFYNTIKTPGSKVKRDEPEDVIMQNEPSNKGLQQDSYKNKEFNRDFVDNKGKNKSDQKRQRVSSSSSSSRSSIKDRKRDNPRNSRSDSSDSSNKRRKYSDDSRDKHSSRSDRRRRRVVKADRKNERRRPKEYPRNDKQPRPEKDSRREQEQRDFYRKEERRVADDRIRRDDRRDERRNERKDERREEKKDERREEKKEDRKEERRNDDRVQRKDDRRDEGRDMRKDDRREVKRTEKDEEKRDGGQRKRNIKDEQNELNQGLQRKERDNDYKMRKLDDMKDDSQVKYESNKNKEMKPESTDKKICYESKTAPIPESKHHKQIKELVSDSHENKMLKDEKAPQQINAESSQGSAGKSILDRIKVKKSDVKVDQSPTDNAPTNYLKEEKLDNLIISEIPQQPLDVAEETPEGTKKNLRNLINSLKKSQST